MLAYLSTSLSRESVPINSLKSIIVERSRKNKEMPNRVVVNSSFQDSYCMTITLQVELGKCAVYNVFEKRGLISLEFLRYFCTERFEHTKINFVIAFTRLPPIPGQTVKLNTQTYIESFAGCQQLLNISDSALKRYSVAVTLNLKIR
jgi:hypothetical protein